VRLDASRSAWSRSIAWIDKGGGACGVHGGGARRGRVGTAGFEAPRRDSFGDLGEGISDNDERRVSGT